MANKTELNGLRRARVARGLSQSALAGQAGISRQALSAIESGTYQPGVVVALKLAHELGETVESLFGKQEAHLERLAASWAGTRGPAHASAAGTQRVALARVSGRLVAVPQAAAALRLSPAGGLLERATQSRAEVAALHSREEIESTLLVAGCDPAVSIFADWLTRRRAPASVAAVPTGSANALAALVAGRVHAAGIHLRDPRSGEYNLAAVRRALGHRRLVIVNFARWELGLATRTGNPMQIRGFADLARLRIVNRERGSGARAALDEEFAALGVKPARIEGYGRELGGHLEVAAALAAGEADTGVTIRVAANAYGLDFIALREERYDFVIAETELDSPPVQAMLDALNSHRFALELHELCAYDTSETGRVIAHVH
jgi:molybdate-binding protein/DNA-binding XRE family transcriptional regulator